MKKCVLHFVPLVLIGLAVAAPASRAADGESVTIPGLHALFKQDWSDSAPCKGSFWCPDCKKTHTYQGTRTRHLALVPGKDNDAGSAWLVVKDSKLRDENFNPFKDRYTAWKGTYTLRPEGKDSLLLRLSFTRKYEGMPGRENAEDVIDWTAVRRFEPQGLELEIPLDDGALPAKVVMAAGRAYFVDENGKEITKRDAPATLSEKVSGLGAVRKLTNSDTCLSDATLKLRPADYGKELLTTSPPPGFKPRSRP